MVSVDDAAEAHPGQWILMKVTEVSAYDAPVAGIVVATSPTRDGIQPILMDRLVHNPPDGRYLTLFGGKIPRTPEEWRELLDRDEDEVFDVAEQWG